MQHDFVKRFIFIRKLFLNQITAVFIDFLPAEFVPHVSQAGAASHNMAAPSSVEMLSRVPIIFVVGATGTGKTKLSVELAKRFNGEIINADSMQVSRVGRGPRGGDTR